MHYHFTRSFIQLARLEKNKVLLNEAIEKYNNALEINPNFYAAISNLGICLFDLGRVSEEPTQTQVFNEAIDKFLAAEKLQNGEATYCLACAYSHMNKIEEALKWFEKTMKTNSYPYRDLILKDDDLSNIKDLPKFKELLDKYLPKKTK